ncbi:cytochrome c biogenesis protein [Candidatus Lucifugimonas marina]|uniref:Heme exporter protein C n=1 Tax=Candidatus Lucifugimonas marina TaxID=3038979 RepID=A0AAJ5ZHU8_9CHLR|nr:cytochrome C assembly protein [SAR202 cluster bacterium JH702]MDG0868379.1 cytochrome C assembly protein [SAR202 cluster bacterium JH639]WFG35014.1 cytochrome C assembly protein [SAR202 cluster bacterium JH545]WFG38971.1 cytochrome C assembly protein [SAR202 cluster bacterium JH1073]
MLNKVLDLLDPLLILSAALMGVALYLIFVWVPTETNQGAVQRILYFHVPVAWGSMMGIFVVSGSSFMYLWKKNEKWDRLAVASAEVGVIFGAMMLLSGMIWARPVWAVWWTGEAKLTTALILFFIYVAYLMFRAYFPPGTQRQRLAAIIGVIGAVDTPIIYFAANLWSQAHPPLVTGPAADAESALGSDLGTVLLASTLAFSFLFIYMVQTRYKIRKSEDDLVELKRASSASAMTGAN